MKIIVLFTFALSFALAVYSQQEVSPGDSAVTGKLFVLVETERAFARTALEKDTKSAFLEYLAEDGVVFEPTAKNGKKVWQNRPASVGLLSWRPVWGDINGSGTLGYTTGPWEFRPAGRDGEPVAFGEYVTIWKDQGDRTFRAVLDIGISHSKPDSPVEEFKYPLDAGRKTAKDGKFPKGGVGKRKRRSSDVRVLRDDALPYGALNSPIDSSEGDLVTDATPTCDGEGALRYCFGTGTMKRDGKLVRGNFLHIWKNRGGSWVIVIDLFSAVPE